MNGRLPFSVLACLACLFIGGELVQAGEDSPVALAAGPHLLLDDYLVAKSDRVERNVTPPRRFLVQPVVTGAPEHQNWQPFLTVLHDPALPAERRFRMWYNVDVVDDPADGNFFGMTGLLESADGVRWPGPYERLTTLTIDGRVRFGASVLDEGSKYTPAAERFKMMYFDAGNGSAGPRIAFSADGAHWNVHNSARPIINTTNGNDIWTASFDPIRKRYFLFGKLMAPYTPYSWIDANGRPVPAIIRKYRTSFSTDFKTWSPLKTILSPDDKDSGITQWYGAAGFQTRGDLIVGFLRELRDDLSPKGVPQEAIDANTGGAAGLGASGLAEKGSGMGYTVLIWTRDGETWTRDRYTDKFFEPDPTVGAWDHAMSWIGTSVPVGDEVYLYYAGYRWGHKYRHSVDRQFGLVKMKRDRYVARRAGAGGGQLTTPLVTLGANKLTLNADATGGEVRVQVSDAAGKPIAGLTFADCRPVTSDSLAALVEWKTKSLADVVGQPVRLGFALRSASLFAFELTSP